MVRVRAGRGVCFAGEKLVLHTPPALFHFSVLPTTANGYTMHVRFAAIPMTVSMRCPTKFFMHQNLRIDYDDQGNAAFSFLITCSKHRKITHQSQFSSLCAL
jgi:hypothetical protein